MFLGAIFLVGGLVPSSKIVINLPRTNGKLHYKEETPRLAVKFFKTSKASLEVSFLNRSIL